MNRIKLSMKTSISGSNETLRLNRMSNFLVKEFKKSELLKLQ